VLVLQVIIRFPLVLQVILTVDATRFLQNVGTDTIAQNTLLSTLGVAINANTSWFFPPRNFLSETYLIQLNSGALSITAQKDNKQ